MIIDVCKTDGSHRRSTLPGATLWYGNYGAIAKAVTHVRADHAKNQGVPLPEELATAVEKVLLWKAASSAAEGVTREVVEKNLLKDVECQYSAGIFLLSSTLLNA